eukprot:gene7955-18750_t
MVDTPSYYVLTTTLLFLAATCGTVRGASTILEITCSEPVGGDGGDDASFRFSTLLKCNEGLGAISAYASAALDIETAGNASAIDSLTCQPTLDDGGYSMFGCSNDEVEGAQTNVLSILSAYVRSILPWNDAFGEPLPMVACAAGGYIAFPAASLQSRCVETAIQGNASISIPLFNDLVQSLFPWADMTASTVCADIFECKHVATALTHFVNSTLTCSGNGDYIEGEGGSDVCVCSDDWVGPACAYSDNSTCSRNGVVDALTGQCSCTASFLGVACAYSDATTCLGRGTVDALTGICECAGPPDNAFYGNYTGVDCSGAPQLESLEDEENARYTTYYIAFGILVTLTFLGCLGCAWCLAGTDNRGGIKELGCCTKLTLAPFVIAFRVSDFMSDWAFYAITLRNGGFFFNLAIAEGVNYAAIHSAARAFCILGSILFVVEIPLGFVGRISLWGEEAEKNKGGGDQKEYADGYHSSCSYFWVPATTILALLVEDAPQLYLQTEYFKTVGFENADGVATFAFVMSALSLLLNLITVLFECKRLRGAPAPWRRYACGYYPSLYSAFCQGGICPSENNTSLHFSISEAGI